MVQEEDEDGIWESVTHSSGIKSRVLVKPSKVWDHKIAKVKVPHSEHVSELDKLIKLLHVKGVLSDLDVKHLK